MDPQSRYQATCKRKLYEAVEERTLETSEQITIICLLLVIRKNVGADFASACIPLLLKRGSRDQYCCSPENRGWKPLPQRIKSIIQNIGL
jgi:hypothetical protein